MTDVNSATSVARADAAVTDLWRYYEEHAAQARQHETLRASVTSTLSGVAAAVVGLAGVGGIERSDVLTGSTVVLIGLLGAALSIKHYERNRFHTRVLAEIRGEIDALRLDSARKPRSTGDLRKQAEREHGADFAVFRLRDRQGGSRKGASSPWVSVRLHLLWIGLPLVIALVGGVVVALSLAG